MPVNIQYFVLLSIVQAVISIGGAPFGPSNVRTAGAYGTSMGITLLWALFVWLAAWQREGWARWGVVALVVISIPGFLFIVKSYRAQYAVFVGAQLVSLLVDFAALYYLFSGDARQWFK